MRSCRPGGKRPLSALACVAAAGVYLSKDLMTIAGHSLKANIATLAPLVLPISEQLLFFLNLVARKVRPPPLRPPHSAGNTMLASAAA